MTVLEYYDINLLDPLNQNINKRFGGLIYKIDVIVTPTNTSVASARVIIDNEYSVRYFSDGTNPSNYEIGTQIYSIFDGKGFPLRKNTVQISGVSFSQINSFYVRVYYEEKKEK